MSKNVSPRIPLLLTVLSVGMLLLASGCNPPGETRVITLFTAERAAVAKADIDVGDIQSLLVTLTKVELDKIADTPGAQDGEAEKVVAFEGDKEVDLIQLRSVSEVLAAAEFPPGRYGKIRLSIANPRLVLASDPSTVFTDIQLTANSRLFVDGTFVIPEGQQSLILLDFGGVKLVATGQGKYVLTPQLDADLEVVSAEVLTTGVIVSISPDDSTFVLGLSAGDLEVVYTEADIFRIDDTETPTGTAADLTVGAQVEVFGTLFVDGSVAAQTVRILPPG